MACMNIYRKCIDLLDAGRNVVQVTVVKATRGTPGKEGFKLLLSDDGKLHGTVGGGALEHRAIEEAKQVLKNKENKILELNLAQIGMKCGGQVTLVFEYLRAEKSFILFGGGHVGRALVPILGILGFRVIIFDSREEVRDQIGESPDRTVIIGDYNDITPVKELVKQAMFCFIATHGHDYDFAVLKQLLELSAGYRYIGLIGSSTKVSATFKRLQEEGIAVPEYLFAPVGINLGGDTAAEIAVSVAAEVVARIHQASANHMSSGPENKKA